jgi:T5orf172 domain
MNQKMDSSLEMLSQVGPEKNVDVGYVYILTNGYYKRIFKIGQSTDLEKRVKDLYKTGVPEEFDVEDYVRVKNHKKIERMLHKMFSDFRVNEDREFFGIHRTETTNKNKKYNSLLAKVRSVFEILRVSNPDLNPPPFFENCELPSDNPTEKEMPVSPTKRKKPLLMDEKSIQRRQKYRENPEYQKEANRKSKEKKAAASRAGL